MKRKSDGMKPKEELNLIMNSPAKVMPMNDK